MSFKSVAAFAALASVFAFGLSGEARAVDIDPVHEYSEAISAARDIGALKAQGMFGESISHYSGKVDFAVVDVSLPGHNALPVSVGRRLSIENRQGMGYLGGFGEWDAEVPYIEGVFDSNFGWTMASGDSTNRHKRCSLGGRPKVDGSVEFSDDEIWHGYNVHLPQRGSYQLLVNDANAFPMPTDGGSYPWITTDFNRVGCIGQLKNKPASEGEGFVLLTPDGMRYYFDWMVERYARGLRKTDDVGVSRKRLYLLATRVADRHGNFVDYSYSDTGALQSITASDGRSISLGYANGRVSNVYAAGKVWSYEYNASGSLTSVTRPDGSRWSYQASNSMAFNPPNSLPQLDDYEATCDEPEGAGGSFDYVITHPSGARGVFKFGTYRHYRVNVPWHCTMDVAPFDKVYWMQGEDGTMEAIRTHIPGHDKLWLSNYFDTLALLSITVDGPGGPANTVGYSYDTVYFLGFCGNPFSGEACVGNIVPGSNPSVSTDYKWVTETRPDGTIIKRRFGVGYGTNEGRLLEEQVLSGTNVVRSINYQHVTDAEVASLPFPAKVGFTLVGDATAAMLRPVKKTVVAQQGVSFTSEATTFDLFGRTLAVSQSSSLGSRTTSQAYHDNLAKWVLGQQASTSINGIVTNSTDFDAVTAMPLRQYAFGKLTQSLAYYGAGHLKSVSDGRSNTTTFSSWKRGVPQLIQNPDSTTESAVVNDDGTIASTTDENGFTTTYEYDPMGRLAKVTYPEADTVAWAPTTQVFEPVAATEYGIPAGHWRQTVATGNYRKVSYFDGLWRPVLSREYDMANVTATSRFSAFGYDEDGRTTFASYPVASASTVAAITQGVRTQYDALGRPTRAEQDNELGTAPLVATTDYLTGFKTRITNPRGKQVTTSYLAYGEPTTDWPVSIVKHATASTTINTDIARNAFGKPLSMTQRNDAGTVTATRSYSYNANQELCRTSEPEGGTTVFAYDGAGNLVWSAPGVPTTTTCTSGISATAKIGRGYDERNRITALTFPDGLGNTTYTYYPDGQPHTLATDNGASNVVTTTYVYNKRRLLTGENLQWPNVNWNLGYGYSANGHLASQTYPDNTSVTYLPNALGQPTQASAYATGVSYYPNGSIKQFTYGNGIVHDLTQNLRGLAERSRDAYGGVAVHDDNYDYDANGNVAAISDGLPGAPGNRTMTYDHFDRLTGVTAPMFGGDGVASFGYDVLDNLLSAKVGNKSHVTYTHDATRNLLSTVHNSAGTVTDTLGYDVRGNVTTRTNATYTFDRGNRLRSVTPTSGLVSSYVYDGHGRRVRDIANGGSKYSQYNQAGQLMYASDLRLDLRTNYIHLGGSLVATRRLDPVSGAVATRYQHTDALGSPVAVTDPTRTVIERNQYAPYGAQISGPVSDGPGYTGHVQDTAAGLTYMQQRYYDPALGRFLSVDPVTADGNTGGNFNRYWYANNNPYRFTDPDGRQSVGEMIDSGAEGCGAVSCAGWAALNATWKVLGAEGVSQLADNGWSSTSGGNRASAGLEIASVLPPVRLARAGLLGNAMFKSALQSFKGTALTNVGRALTKHPEVVALTKDTLRNTFRTDAQLNAAGADALKEIMRNGQRTLSTHSRYGDIVTYQIPNGFGARFEATTNKFIGFINP